MNTQNVVSSPVVPVPSFTQLLKNRSMVKPTMPANTVVTKDKAVVKPHIRQEFYAITKEFRRQVKDGKAKPSLFIGYINKRGEGGLFRVAGIESERGRAGSITLTLQMEHEGKIVETTLDLRKDGPEIICIGINQ